MQPEWIERFEWMDPTLSLSVRIGLAFVLGCSLVGKLRDPIGFAKAIRDYDILPASATTATAALLVAGEALRRLLQSRTLSHYE